MNECVRRVLVPSSARENAKAGQKRSATQGTYTGYTPKERAQAAESFLGTWPTTVLSRVTATAYGSFVLLFSLAHASSSLAVGAPNVLLNVVTTNAAINAENLHRCSFTVIARTVSGR